MSDNVRLQRLEADYQAMRQLVRLMDRVKVEGVSGKPPTLYRLALNVRSIQEVANSIKYAENHRVEIRLPLGYPRNPPVCRMLTPVFHPNIAPHNICIGDHWTAGESLTSLVLRICEMLAYQSYNIKSPLNGEAARWTENNIQQLPVDDTNYFIEPSEIGTPVEVKYCGNCNTRLVSSYETCVEDHILCADCAMYCDECGRMLCLICGELECPEGHTKTLSTDQDETENPEPQSSQYTATTATTPDDFSQLEPFREKIQMSLLRGVSIGTIRQIINSELDNPVSIDAFNQFVKTL